MNHVRLDHQRSEEGGFFGTVGVFEPMDEAGHKISQHDDAERLENDEQEGHAFWSACIIPTPCPLR